MTTDVLVLGSGLAGLTVARSLPGVSVTIISKGDPGAGSTRLAQGGIAVALADDDSPERHLADTLAAGDGHCDEEVVRTVVEGAPEALGFLASCGVCFDRSAAGQLALSREGGHSRRRVVHSGGDATGRAVITALTRDLGEDGRPRVLDGFLLELLWDGERVGGALIAFGNEVVPVAAGAVVLATGGFGQLYSVTTNPTTCTGDGLAAALRAGAAVRDLEFVQFHPTALHLPVDPRPLATEALRGEGAILVDADGNGVMAGVDARGDLAPRDVVSRAIAMRMREHSTDHVFLDVRPIGRRELERQFPNLLRTCRSFGLDPVAAPVPVAPAAHYAMGGVATDLEARTSLPGLYAVGEVACTGLHGANRLASNSLLEAVVMGRRAAAVIADELIGGRRRAPELGASWPRPVGPSAWSAAPATLRRRLREQMMLSAGVIRDGHDLSTFANELERWFPTAYPGGDQTVVETANLASVAKAVVTAALARHRTCGAHFRVDADATTGEPGPASLRGDRRRELTGPERDERATVGSAWAVEAGRATSVVE